MGQGIAGTLLTHFLLKKGNTVQVIDNQHKDASSLVAAGLINPVTGRRYVKSWRIGELLPFALETYRELEQQLSINFFHQRNILRSLFNSGDENNWQARAQEESYQKYILPDADISSLEGKTNRVFAYGEVQNAYHTEMHKLVKAYQNYLHEMQILRSEKFDFEQMNLTQEGVEYNDFIAKKIIFCDGIGGAKNPFWSHLPWVGSKGEVLIVKMPEADFSKMYKYRIFVIPLPKKDHYWVGSMYAWNYADAEPTESGKSYLVERLRDVVTVPFEVVEHKAAIRPTVKDRRPYLGMHSEFPQVGIFNGLGTKGASLGPYFAAQMADFLNGVGEIDAEVYVGRFG